MALYLGESERLKIVINNVVYKLNLYSSGVITNHGMLLSFDDFVLRDVNGLYLTVPDDNVARALLGVDKLGMIILGKE